MSCPTNLWERNSTPDPAGSGFVMLNAATSRASVVAREIASLPILNAATSRASVVAKVARFLSLALNKATSCASVVANVAVTLPTPPDELRLERIRLPTVGGYQKSQGAAAHCSNCCRFNVPDAYMTAAMPHGAGSLYWSLPNK